MTAVRTTTEGPIRTLTIDRPEARNALDDAVLTGLIEGLEAARRDPSVRVVVLTGAGDKAFCAGADLAAGLARDRSAVEAHDQRGALRALFGAVDRLDKPLVGRLQGHALAGGLGVALACDLLVAADDVTLGTPEVKVGLWPFVISALLVEHVGPKRALQLMMTGERISAERARDWGLLNIVVPRAELDDAVSTLCAQLVRAAPVALMLGRRATVEARDMGRREAMAYLHGMLDLTLQTADVAEGIGAFLEKREPRWSGR